MGVFRGNFSYVAHLTVTPNSPKMINAMEIPSKQAIVEVASMLGGRDILYSYVATENDHIVSFNCPYDLRRWKSFFGDTRK